jgi:hypothetical protein
MSEEGVITNSGNNEKRDSEKKYLYRIANNWIDNKFDKRDHPITKGKEELK